MGLRTISIALLAAAAAAIAAPADAAVLVQAQGLYDASTPVTAYTAPNALFSLSFTVDDTLADPFQATATDVTYLLNGVGIAVSDIVSFQADGLVFVLSPDLAYQLGFTGADIGSDGTPDYPTFGAYQIQLATGLVFGPVIGSAVIGTSAVSAIPEPSAWLLLVVGFGGVGLALRRPGPEPRTSLGLA